MQSTGKSDATPLIERQGARLSALEKDVHGLATDLSRVVSAVEKQWAAISDIKTAVTELIASAKTQPRFELTRTLGAVATVGAVTGMLIAGITYVVNGSQAPQLSEMRCEARLQDYRLQQMQQHIARATAPQAAR